MKKCEEIENHNLLALLAQLLQNKTNGCSLELTPNFSSCFGPLLIQFRFTDSISVQFGLQEIDKQHVKLICILMGIKTVIRKNSTDIFLRKTY